MTSNFKSFNAKDAKVAKVSNIERLGVWALKLLFFL
jgi:hypothetical protein